MLRYGMPRLPDEMLQGVAFLYRTADEAATNARIGGTCFLVSKFAPRATKKLGHPAYIPFWVSNRHVVWAASSPVVRMNRRDGSQSIIEYDCVDWECHPNGDDLAAVCAFGDIDPCVDLIKGVPDWYLITQECMEKWKIGIGDDVAMVGRFVNHQGRDRIQPAARLGNVSMMPQPIWNKTINKDQLSYAVEMRSRTGFSGSPVGMYRRAGTSLMDLPAEIQEVHGILGVCWGHILDEDGENAWLNGVIPAWKILELFEAPKLKEAFDSADAYVDSGEDSSAAVPSVAFEEQEIPTGKKCGDTIRISRVPNGRSSRAKN